MGETRRLVWVGDAVAPTGFARVTHSIVPELQARGWDVHVLGINYLGDPHGYPFPIYPASRGGDMYGLGRIRALVDRLEPDAVVVLNDPWIVAEFAGLRLPVPLVGYMPVDAPNIRESVAHALSGIHLAIFYTRFGLDELRARGFSQQAAVIPHGVDLDVFQPMPRAMARRSLGLDQHLPAGSFIVGNVNRNQPRKRLDLTVQYFARWLEEMKPDRPAFLYLHCAERDQGWDLRQLADYYGVRRRLLMTHGFTTPVHGPPTEWLRMLYAALDVQVSTTLGEGWGLTTMEGMACGVPQIVPEWSALAEWPRGGVRYVPVTSYAAAAQQLNTIGGVADAAGFVAALEQLYRDDLAREALGRRGR
ncbi:MAG TPA: glycosyltransferase family 4 protein, partial [Woeseiaceae bacterium]|nr:glycosyltransferase family 4 protein [Woeseiaceae bacterium]